MMLGNLVVVAVAAIVAQRALRATCNGLLGAVSLDSVGSISGDAPEVEFAFEVGCACDFVWMEFVHLHVDFAAGHVFGFHGFLLSAFRLCAVAVRRVVGGELLSPRILAPGGIRVHVRPGDAAHGVCRHAPGGAAVVGPCVLNPAHRGSIAAFCGAAIVPMYQPRFET